MPFAAQWHAGKDLGGARGVLNRSCLWQPLRQTGKYMGGVGRIQYGMLFAAHRHAGKELGGARGELNMACCL